jgi:hypothetical protein
MSVIFKLGHYLRTQDRMNRLRDEKDEATKRQRRGKVRLINQELVELSEELDEISSAFNQV